MVLQEVLPRTPMHHSISNSKPSHSLTTTIKTTRIMWDSRRTPCLRILQRHLGHTDAWCPGAGALISLQVCWAIAYQPQMCMDGRKEITRTAVRQLLLRADNRQEVNLTTITLLKYPKISTQTSMLSRLLTIQLWGPVLSKDMRQSASHIVQLHTICIRTMGIVVPKVSLKHR